MLQRGRTAIVYELIYKPYSHQARSALNVAMALGMPQTRLRNHGWLGQTPCQRSGYRRPGERSGHRENRVGDNLIPSEEVNGVMGMQVHDIDLCLYSTADVDDGQARLDRSARH